MRREDKREQGISRRRLTSQFAAQNKKVCSISSQPSSWATTRTKTQRPFSSRPAVSWPEKAVQKGLSFGTECEYTTFEPPFIGSFSYEAITISASPTSSTRFHLPRLIAIQSSSRCSTLPAQTTSSMSLLMLSQLYHTGFPSGLYLLRKRLLY